MSQRWSRVSIAISLTTWIVAGSTVAQQTGQTDPPDLSDQIGPCPTAPGEVTGVLMGAPNPSTLSWDVEACAEDYNVYRGLLSDLRLGLPPRCHGDEIPNAEFPSPSDPDLGDGFFYLVTAEALREATPGTSSAGQTRPLLGQCDTVVRHHVLNRTGYGLDEWSQDRIIAVGNQGYIDEQLAPDLIDDSNNTPLNNALGVLTPPETIQELQGQDLVRAVYSRKQLEQAATVFWTNHFNTEYTKTFPFFNNKYASADRRRLEATTLHYKAEQDFRNLAFNGTFRQIVDASAYSSAMIIYLDTRNNVAGNPNENYSRELLELHTMGVDGGYTDFDIAELARVFTGWDVCKKVTADVDDPLAPCVDEALIDTDNEPDGLWVPNLRLDRHDCGSKVLFQGTAEELTIPDTCGNLPDGLNDVPLALDAIAAHPSTGPFISTKLLAKFVTDAPTQAMIDNVVAVWNATSPDPGGLLDVLGEVLDQAEFLDPDQFRNKIKTPFEHMASAFRAVRGNTNGTSTVRGYLERMGQLLHQNPVPTGYPEDGDSWIDTNNTLERQDFGANMSDGTGTSFGADVIGLIQDNNVSLNSAPDMVDFLASRLFGSAISPAERQDAINFLETDDSGNPDLGFTLQRIRQLAGYMLGFAQFQEQ